MKFGLVLTSTGDEASPQAQVDEHKRLLRTADEAGFDIFFAGQHFLQRQLRYLQPVPYLAHLAATAPRLRVGTGILLLPLLHPVEVAEQLATLDVLSGGQAVMGVGLGYSDLELDAFGVDRKSRVSRFEESVELIRALWSGDDVRHRGLHWNVEAVAGAVRPIQPGGIPIWVAGQTEPAVRRAARVGDAWYVPPFPTHAAVRRLRQVFLEAREAAGRPPEREFPVRRELFLGSSPNEAAQRIAGPAGGRLTTYASWGMRQERDVPRGFTDTDAASLQDRFLLGPPEHCAEQLARLSGEDGMTTFVLKVQWPGLPFEESLRQLERFGEEVIPLLANVGDEGRSESST